MQSEACTPWNFTDSSFFTEKRKLSDKIVFVKKSGTKGKIIIDVIANFSFYWRWIVKEKLLLKLSGIFPLVRKKNFPKCLQYLPPGLEGFFFCLCMKSVLTAGKVEMTFSSLRTINWNNLMVRNGFLFKTFKGVSYFCGNSVFAFA